MIFFFFCTRSHSLLLLSVEILDFFSLSDGSSVNSRSAACARGRETIVRRALAIRANNEISCADFRSVYNIIIIITYITRTYDRIRSYYCEKQIYFKILLCLFPPFQKSIEFFFIILHATAYFLIFIFKLLKFCFVLINSFNSFTNIDWLP